VRRGGWGGVGGESEGVGAVPELLKYSSALPLLPVPVDAVGLHTLVERRRERWGERRGEDGEVG
jgi:hypothetical protein